MYAFAVPSFAKNAKDGAPHFAGDARRDQKPGPPASRLLSSEGFIAFQQVVEVGHVFSVGGVIMAGSEVERVRGRTKDGFESDDLFLAEDF